MNLFDIFLYLVIGVILVIVGFLVLLAFTIGFHKSGRIMGGLYALVAKPGNGKSYMATYYGLDHMKKGRRVFSNFPIDSVDGKLSSRVIEGAYKHLDGTEETFESLKWLMKQNLNRAVLIIDEAHLFFWSRDFARFSKDDKDFFTFLGQHETTVYYLVQHEDRMDTVANDCANLFGVVEKFEIPILEMPLFFTVTWWASETEMKEAVYHPEIKPYDTERHFFNLDVANAYDTRFYGRSERAEYEGITWREFNRRQGKIWYPPRKVSLATFLKGRLRKSVEVVGNTTSQHTENVKKSVIHYSDRTVEPIFQYVLYGDNFVLRHIRSYIKYYYYKVRLKLLWSRYGRLIFK